MNPRTYTRKHPRTGETRTFTYEEVGNGTLTAWSRQGYSPEELEREREAQARRDAVDAGHKTWRN